MRALEWALIKWGHWRSRFIPYGARMRWVSGGNDYCKGWREKHGYWRRV